ncbi:secretin N-terminal domain-containing protein [Sulfurimonas sp.]|uniref:secretin N-terminal domain-containing protein n=1 Tax=Sulfurimonas sp. TaxID=2022749 RepID=UPI0026031971|nr:secretin N-terminal domain-containing protein [Sulfurimonas sp.]
MKFIKITFLVLALSISLFAREQVNVSFSNLAVNDFIKLISKITNKNILINNKINGTVDFVSTSPIYDDELMGILIAVLESKGYTLVQNGSIYEVVRATEAAKHNVKVISSYKNASGSLMVTQAIRVHNENVDIVAAKIRYLISKTAKLMTMRESNTLLITDYPKNIKTIKEVINNLEMRKERVVKIIELKNTEAKKLQSHINEIAKSIFNTKVVSQNVKVLLDTNINGLILIGNKRNVAILEKLIKKLDIESNVNKTVKIFELKNSDAKAVLKNLNDIVAKQVFSDPSLKPNLSASEEINAVIVVGDPTIIKGIKLIIDELDKEKYQVYVQARIIEINKDNAVNLGVRYGFDGAALSAEGLYSLAANFGGAPVQGIVGNALASSLVGSGVAQGFALGAAVDFLETNGASKSISNPSILCVNNKESSIYVGKTISVSTGTVTSTTGLTGLTSSYKREDVGLTLTIKPRVSSNDKVTLDVSVVLENILDDGSKNVTGQPVTSKQEVKTQAILRHGESIIIGGLVKNYERDSVSKVPLLGDIPLIGSWLFSSKAKTKEQDNLVVILTPYVIDKSEKLSKLQKDLGLLAKMQKSYDKEVFQEIKNKKLEVKSDAKP